LRFEVEAQRSPGLSWSSFMARHIEQPGSRHSKPASSEDLVQTLGFRLFLDQARARHDHRVVDRSALTFLPSTTGDRAQILDAAIGARADEDPVDLDVGDLRAGFRPM
jgi:hypothetical protein